MRTTRARASNIIVYIVHRFTLRAYAFFSLEEEEKRKIKRKESQVKQVKERYIC